MFDPIDDHGKPIDVSSTGPAATVKTAGYHEETAKISGFSIVSLHLAIVVDRPFCRQGGICPAVPEDQFAIPSLEIGQV